MPYDLSTILQQIEQQAQTAQQENLKRYQQAMAIYDEIISRYQPGGAFEKKALAELEKRKVREVGGEQQQLISSGLAGTTVMGAVPRKWEAEVGEPARLSLEDILMQRLSAAQTGKAEFIERREDVYPDYSLMAQLASQASAAGGGTSVADYAHLAALGATYGGTPTTGGGGYSYGGGQDLYSQRFLHETEPTIPWYSEQFRNAPDYGRRGELSDTGAGEIEYVESLAPQIAQDIENIIQSGKSPVLGLTYEQALEQAKGRYKAYTGREYQTKEEVAKQANKWLNEPLVKYL